MLLPEIEPAAAFLSAARIARALSARAPASIGVAAFPIDGTELEELMRRADMRLYESRRGRPQGSSRGMTERLSWATAMAEAIDMRMDSRHEHSRAVGKRTAHLGIAFPCDLWQVLPSLPPLLMDGAPKCPP